MSERVRQLLLSLGIVMMSVGLSGLIHDTAPAAVSPTISSANNLTTSTHTSVQQITSPESALDRVTREMLIQRGQLNANVR